MLVKKETLEDIIEETSTIDKINKKFKALLAEKLNTKSLDDSWLRSLIIE
jgi:hypothetical protein